MIAKGSRSLHESPDASRMQLVSHFKYIEHRRRVLSQEHRIFSKDQDVVKRRDAVHDVMGHTSTGVNFHKIVLSPGEDEPVSDWREWTRQVMHDLEAAQGKQLHWYAVSHDNTEHPHVHVVVASTGYNQEKGREESVKLSTKDYDLIRQSGRQHSDYDFHRLIEAQFQELNMFDHMLDRDFEGPQPEREPISFSSEDSER